MLTTKLVLMDSGKVCLSICSLLHMSKELAKGRRRRLVVQELGILEIVVDMLKSRGLMMSHISRKLSIVW